MICMGWNPLKQCGSPGSTCKGLWFWAALAASLLLGAHKHKAGAK